MTSPKNRNGAEHDRGTHDGEESLVVGGWLLCGVQAAAQVATGNVAGTIRDGDGGVLPGATVTLISQARGTTLDTTTNGNGDFVFVKYTIRVTMDGFKTFERTNVPVSAGDRAALGSLALQLGTLTDTVTVSSEAPLIQAQSGERSFAVGSDQIENLPVSNRSWTAMVGLAAPGVNGTTRLGGAGNNNFQLDGVNTMDTGNNGNLLNLNTDAIAEVKVVTQGYTAEYGRAAGLQISAVSKSGSNFHRSVFELRRDSDWNANTWANERSGVPKAVSKQDDWGVHDWRPGRQTGWAEQALLLLRAPVFSSHHWRREPEPLPGAHPSRTAGRLLAEH